MIRFERLTRIYSPENSPPWSGYIYTQVNKLQILFTISYASCQDDYASETMQEIAMSNNIILVVGSLHMDQVVHVSRVPQPGETLLGTGSLKLVPGGKGADQAVAMARLGAPVAMAGRVGSDPFGAQLVSALQVDRIDTGMIVVDQQEATGTAFIFLTPDGDNAIVVAAGADMHVGQDQLQMGQIFEAIAQARALVLQLEIPLETVKTLITAGHNGGVPVVLNLAPAQTLPLEVLQQVDVLIVNESEASL